MNTSEWVSLITGFLIMGTVFPLIGTLYYVWSSKVNKLEEKMITKEYFSLFQKHQEMHQIRVEKALGILPKDFTPKE